MKSVTNYSRPVAFEQTEPSRGPYTIVEAVDRLLNLKVMVDELAAECETKAVTLMGADGTSEGLAGKIPSQTPNSQVEMIHDVINDLFNRMASIQYNMRRIN